MNKEWLKKTQNQPPPTKTNKKHLQNPTDQNPNNTLSFKLNPEKGYIWSEEHVRKRRLIFIFPKLNYLWPLKIWFFSVVALAFVIGEFDPKKWGIIEYQDLIIKNQEVNFFNIRSGRKKNFWMSIAPLQIELFFTK